MNITPEAAQSTFYISQLPPLNPEDSPSHILDRVEVQYGDTFVLTRQLLRSRPDYAGKVAVLDCASDAELAGGWRHRFGTTQEDALCYSSTLWPMLEMHKEKYPWRKVVGREKNKGECAGIWSPNVVVFRDELAKECAVLEKKEWVTVGVVSVAALACPPVVPDHDAKRRARGEMRLKLERDVETLKERVRMVLRMAASNGKSVLILAALGCGVWKCPPRQVAEIFTECLSEAEFHGWFERVVAGLYDQEVERTWREVFDGWT